MKLKYFLRGLGTGIIFAALIMLAAYMTSGGYKMSDEEIIKKAEKLGMVMEDDSIITPSTTEATDVKDDTTENDLTTEATTENDNTEDDTTEDGTTEATTEEEPTTEEKTTASDSGDTVTITVQSGMSSYDVAVLLEAADIVDSASDFDVYLNQNGYSTRIEVGEFKVTGDMSYEELAKLLTNG